MSYRDEREALRERVRELEGELDEANERLEGRRRVETPRGNPFLGGPVELRVERALPGELDDEAIARIVGRLREQTGEVGRLERIGDSIAWSPTGRNGRMVELTIERTEEGWRARLTESLRTMVSSLYGGVLGGLGGGGIIIPMTPIFIGQPEWLPFTLIAWFGSVYAGVRLLYGSRARARHREIETLADQIVSIAESRARRSVHARVETADADEALEELAPEADRERERSKR